MFQRFATNGRTMYFRFHDNEAVIKLTWMRGDLYKYSFKSEY